MRRLCEKRVFSTCLGALELAIRGPNLDFYCSSVLNQLGGANSQRERDFRFTVKFLATRTLNKNKGNMVSSPPSHSLITWRANMTSVLFCLVPSSHTYIHK